MIRTFLGMRQPQDFLKPFGNETFLEKTFIYVLLERAEFLCNTAGVEVKKFHERSMI